MNLRTRVALATGVVVVAAGGIGVAVVGATTAGDDNEAPITGSALEQASAAALAHTGEGRVTETEAGDEESYYEVEVTLDDGSEVDVQLDREFRVVGTESEGNEAADSNEGEGSDQD